MPVTQKVRLGSPAVEGLRGCSVVVSYHSLPFLGVVKKSSGNKMQGEAGPTE